MHFPEFFSCTLPEWMLTVNKWFDEGLIDGYLLHDILFWLQEKGIIICREGLDSLA